MQPWLIFLTAPLRNGHLYLDPGSGSFILQLLIAAGLGAIFVLKSYWAKIINFFRGRSSHSDDQQE